MKFARAAAVGALLATAALAFAACTSTRGLVRDSIMDYNMASMDVRLGDSKEEVLARLQPTQENLPFDQRKPPETYVEEGKLIEVYFFRSGFQDDGITTDDEFTPYIFTDGQLTAIGWLPLGGPATQGQARDDITIEQHPWFYHPWYW